MAKEQKCAILASLQWWEGWSRYSIYFLQDCRLLPLETRISSFLLISFAIYAQERSQKLRNWYNLIVQHEGELAELLTTEQGKPLFEAKGEVRYAASYVEWFAEEAKRIYGDIIPSPHPSRRLFSLKQPVGVAALWTPVTVKSQVIFADIENHCEPQWLSNALFQ